MIWAEVIYFTKNIVFISFYFGNFISCVGFRVRARVVRSLRDDVGTLVRAPVRAFSTMAAGMLSMIRALLMKVYKSVLIVTQMRANYCVPFYATSDLSRASSKVV